MYRPPPGLVGLRIALGFVLPLGLANGARELLHGTKFEAGAQIGVLLVGIPLGVWLGFVIARRHELRHLLRGPRIGTRAWEADQTVQLIERMMQGRRAAQARSTSADECARLDAELAHLGRHLEVQRRIAASGDPSPGKGVIAVEPFPGTASLPETEK
jgi:hypothetical protein